MEIPYVDEFVRSGLPGLVDPAAGLDVIVSTYRSVRSYPMGPVALPTRPGLRVTVLGSESDGRLASADLGIIFGMAQGTSVGNAIADAAITERREVAAELQERNELGILPLIRSTKDRPILLVVYAGLSDFEGPVNFVRRVRGEYPSARGVVLTCDCDPGYKVGRLRPLLASGEIAAAAFASGCGGRDEMRAIVDGIISLWPETAVGSG